MRQPRRNRTRLEGEGAMSWAMAGDMCQVKVEDTQQVEDK